MIKSPKSAAFPGDAIVTNSMILVAAGPDFPPAITPLVLEAKAPPRLISALKFPKSCLAPRVEIVK